MTEQISRSAKKPDTPSPSAIGGAIIFGALVGNFFGVVGAIIGFVLGAILGEIYDRISYSRDDQSALAARERASQEIRQSGA